MGPLPGGGIPRFLYWYTTAWAIFGRIPTFPPHPHLIPPRKWRDGDSRGTFSRGKYLRMGIHPPRIRLIGGKWNRHTIGSCAFNPHAPLSRLISEEPGPKLLRAFWSISHSASKSGNKTGGYLTPHHEDFTQNSLLKAVRTHGRQFAQTGKLRLRKTRKLLLPRISSRMGPSRRIHLLRSAPIRPRIIDRFTQESTMANLLKQASGPLPATSSDFRC